MAVGQRDSAGGRSLIGRVFDWLLDWVPTSRGAWAALALIAAIVVFYVSAMLWRHQINDDVTFQPPAEFHVDGGSQAVSMAAALVHREIKDTTWVANSPFPLPSSLLDNMPNFQLGLMYAVSRFTIELADQLGRMRGSSQVDADLDKAAGLLKYDGTIWFWEPSVSIWPTAAAERQYEAGMNALMAFNRRLGDSGAVFDRRADNLIQVLDRVAADLGSTSAIQAAEVANSGWAWFDRSADDAFYQAKGRLYGYAMLLDALGHDFSALLSERRVDALWQAMVDSLKAAAALEPLVISNGYPPSIIAPNHLATQGFYLLRARTQLRELTAVLTR